MKSLVDILIERKKEKEKYFKNYLKYAKLIKKLALKELKTAKVYLFGSIVKGNFLPTSDIDILIVSKNTPKNVRERAKIQAKILKKIGIGSPFEIHLINEKEFEWYKRFIDKKICV